MKNKNDKNLGIGKMKKGECIMMRGKNKGGNEGYEGMGDNWIRIFINDDYIWGWKNRGKEKREMEKKEEKIYIWDENRSILKIMEIFRIGRDLREKRDWVYWNIYRKNYSI